MAFIVSSFVNLFSSVWGSTGKEEDKEGKHPKEDTQHETLSSSPSNGSFLSFVCPHNTKEGTHYEAYQARFPFPTVVPPPVAVFSIKGLFSLSLHSLIVILLSAVVVLSCPIWLGLHLLFLYLDRRQRESWKTYREQWPHKSIPHERPLAYPTNPSFPLQDWHLQCEDGRQRWYYGEPLATPEDGNVLGKAFAAGCTSVEEWRRHRVVGDDGVSPGTLSQSVPPTECSAAMTSSRFLLPGEVQTKEVDMWARRRQLECYQLGVREDGQPLPLTPQKRANAEEAMKDGAAFLMRLQDPFSGHWPNDYSGCMFLTPGLLIVKYIIAGGAVEEMFCGPLPGHQHVSPTKILSSFTLSEEEKEGEEQKPQQDVSPSARSSVERAAEEDPAPCRCAEATRSELIRYLRNYQNEDGGFGQHTEGHSTMLGSVLSYVSLRLLGVSKKDSAVERCRRWIHREGGAGYTPTWGKVWLSILGVYNWEGIAPVPPELLLLPDWIPFSLGRSWCHSRVIAIPFSYFYGQRWSAPLWSLTAQIREEIYLEPYENIHWESLREACCAKDLYTPLSVVYKVASKVLNVWEKHHIPWIRKKALERCWTHMAYDDENTNFICLGPVNKSLNMLATYIREGLSSARLRCHEERTWDYLYMNRAGMKMNGYNGSQLWDTSFAVQAICACQLEEKYKEGMQFAHHYVDIAQVTEDPMAADLFYRHRTKGAWNFSTRNQGWQVSDCTAEGLRVLLLLKSFPFPQSRLFDGVDEILSLRNVSGDGGWASYEPSRAPSYVELMNCAELFQDVMVEYSYAECSSSCVHTLSLFRQHYPWYRAKEVDSAIREGITCILQKQRADGSFYGSWAVCFTYAAWIVSSAIHISGVLPHMEYHPTCQKLIHFLLSHQNDDGGWGEDVNSCVRGVWTDSPDGSQVVNTAWAVMAIMNASGSPFGTPNSKRKLIVDAVRRGIELIMSRQLASGDWKQERISGVFNGNNPIHYPGYKNCMTVWALGKYVQWEQHYSWSFSSTSSSCLPELKKLQ